MVPGAGSLPSPPMVRRVAVLGGGLQGASVALELALAGVEVHVYERHERCLAGASSHNEGKIHLGFVYANDPSLATARTLISGAIAFAPLLRRWLGSDAVDSIPVSGPFYYVVHEESMLGVDEVAAHLEQCRSILLESNGAAPDYFGSDHRAPSVRLPDAEGDSLFDGRRTRAAFRTPEIGIDSGVLADLVRERLAGEDRIESRCGALVGGVEANGQRVTVEFEHDGGAQRESYDHVVNTLWDGRLAIDRTAGVAPERPWLYRLKHYVRMHAPAVAPSIPSTTIVLGPYGDVVAYDNGSVYLSWYPAGMVATSSELAPPQAWALVPEEPDALRAATSEGLAEVIPAVAGLTADAAESLEVGGGVIVAWGETDIDDAASGLHERHAIGPRSHGRYHSVDTGKLTTAPLFGKQAADRILQW